MKASIKQGQQHQDLIKISSYILNLKNHERVQRKNLRIAVPDRVKYGREILSDGLGNVLSNNIVHNSNNKLGIHIKIFQIFLLKFTNPNNLFN